LLTPIPIPLSVVHDQLINKHNIVTDFGSTLYFWRTFLGLSQRDLVALMGGAKGRSRSNISRMEAGKRLPSIGYAEQLALALDIPVDWLFQVPTEIQIEMKTMYQLVWYVKELSIENREWLLIKVKEFAGSRMRGVA